MLFRSDRKSTRLNSSHLVISYAVFCLKKKKQQKRAASKVAEGIRTGKVKPETTESQIALTLTIDGPGVVSVASGLRFFFFMLAPPAKNYPFPLNLTLQI